MTNGFSLILSMGLLILLMGLKPSGFFCFFLVRRINPTAI